MFRLSPLHAYVDVVLHLEIFADLGYGFEKIQEGHQCRRSYCCDRWIPLLGCQKLS